MRCRDQGFGERAQTETVTAEWRQVPVCESRSDITPGRAATNRKTNTTARMQCPVLFTTAGWVGGKKKSKQAQAESGRGLSTGAARDRARSRGAMAPLRHARRHPVTGPVAMKETHISFGGEVAFFLFVGARSGLLVSRSLRFARVS